MDLYFAGAEQPIYLRTLAELGVKHVAISFYEWQKRHSTDDLYKHVPKDVKVAVTAGVAKKETLHWESFAQDYVEFCERNADECLIYDLDAPFCPPDLRQSVRAQLAMFPNLVVFPAEDESLEALSGTYERLGINARLSKSIPTNELRRIAATLYGSNVTDPKVIRGARLAASTSFSWLSGRRYGELWVFARNKLYHYSAENLARAVKIHARDIESLGVSPEKCISNDREALTHLAVNSLLVMSKTLSKRPRDRSGANASDASENSGGANLMESTSVDPAALLSANGALPVRERERNLIPVVGINMQEGVPKIESKAATLRQCDTCHLSTVCPRYKAESSCAFELPVEIKTDAQWESASQALLEMQFQRISFGLMAEQLEGGSLTPRLGQEIDRFYKMLTNVKSLKEAPVAPGGGALSRIFGAEPEIAEGEILNANQENNNDYEEADIDYEEADIVDEEGGTAGYGYADYEEIAATGD